MTHQKHILSVFTALVAVLLPGLMIFSVIRNIRGLETEFPGSGLVWQGLIAITITLAAFILCGSSALAKTKAHSHSLFLGGFMFSLASFFLSFSGAAGDMKTRYEYLALRDPEVLTLKNEIAAIINRQNEFGITQRTKTSLLQREKELRAELKTARARAMNLAQNRRRQEAEVKPLGIAFFAALPEIGIMIFSVLLVSLWGQLEELKQSKTANTEVERFQGNVFHEPAPNPGMRQLQAAPSNGKVPAQPVSKTMEEYDPFK